jgi:hypothetical protein
MAATLIAATTSKTFKKNYKAAGFIYNDISG